MTGTLQVHQPCKLCKHYFHNLHSTLSINLPTTAAVARNTSSSSIFSLILSLFWSSFLLSLFPFSLSLSLSLSQSFERKWCFQSLFVFTIFDKAQAWVLATKTLSLHLPPLEKACKRKKIIEKIYFSLSLLSFYPFSPSSNNWKEKSLNRK